MIHQKLSILIILYEENFEMINKCLEKIKDFKIIIIDNANNKSLKDKIIKKFNIHKYFLNKKILVFQKQRIKEYALVILNIYYSLELIVKLLIQVLNN